MEILEDGRLGMPDEVLERLEVVIGAVHSHFRLGRRQQTRQRHLEKLAERQPASTTDDASDPFDAEAVRLALDALSDDHRTILVLRYQQGLSYHEIAQVLGLPPGTIASRLNRARQALRAVLAAADDPLATQNREEA